MSVSTNRIKDKEFIKKRWNLLKQIRWFWPTPWTSATVDIFKLKNNNEMNKVTNCGRSKKRKARHGHATYRHHGAYGKAIKMNNNELRQQIDMDQQMKEYKGGEL